MGGVTAPANFAIQSDYINNSAPLPSHSDSRNGDTYKFTTCYYADISNTSSGIFDPTASPVQIAFNDLKEVIFRITNSLNSDPVQNAVVHVDEAALEATDSNGETSTWLATGRWSVHHQSRSTQRTNDY